MNGPPSAPSVETTPPRKHSTAWVRWLSIGGLILVAGLAIRSWSFSRLANLPVESAALPRPVHNAPFVVTPPIVVDKMLEMAKVTADDLVYDLGCGDGRIVVAAAKTFGCRAVGFDIDPERVKEARENAEKNGVQDLVTIEQEDVFTLDLRQASVLTMYLLPKMVEKLVPQIQAMAPGSRIVCHDFGMEEFQPDESIVIKDPETGQDHHLHVWHIPLVPKKKR